MTLPSLRGRKKKFGLSRRAEKRVRASHLLFRGQGASHSGEGARRRSRQRTGPQLEIVPALSPAQISLVRRLFKEYAASIGISLCFQNFEEELASLPGRYARPTGALWLAEFEGKLAGCVALRALGRHICEMKRLYVRPEYRGQQIGRALAERVLEEARQLGYRAIVLDTLSSMKPARALYASLGFKRTKPYGGKGPKGVVYMRRSLKMIRPSVAANR